MAMRPVLLHLLNWEISSSSKDSSGKVSKKVNSSLSANVLDMPAIFVEQRRTGVMVRGPHVAPVWHVVFNAYIQRRSQGSA